MTVRDNIADLFSDITAVNNGPSFVPRVAQNILDGKIIIISS